MFSKKTKGLVVASIVFLASGGFAGVLWYEVFRTGESLRSDLQLLENQKGLTEIYTQLESTLEDTKVQRAQLSQYVLEGQKDTIPLLSQLDRAASARNLDFVTEDLSVRITDEVGFDELVAAFSFSGTQAAVSSMLRLFETLPQHSYISEYNVTRTLNPTTGRFDMDASLSIVISIIEEK